MPYNWTRIPDDEVALVNSFEEHDNADATSWVLIDERDVSRVHPVEVRGPYKTVAAAKKQAPFRTDI